MPRFAANLTMLFTELAFMDRFAAAADAGFAAVEFLFPYPWPAEALAGALHAHGLQLVLHNLPAGDWAAGERGIACDPARREEFAEGAGQAIAYATTLGCTRVNCLAGIPPPGLAPAQARATLVENLRHAAPRFAEAGLELLLEPVNTRDIPGFFVSRTDQALAIIGDVASPNLRLQYDIYHAQVMEGDIAGTIARHLDRIGHMQLADSPGRNEPGTGELNFGYLFDRIDALGYQGWIGCEYRPATTTQAGLGWFTSLGGRQ